MASTTSFNFGITPKKIKSLRTLQINHTHVWHIKSNRLTLLWYLLMVLDMFLVMFFAFNGKLNVN